MTPRTLLSVVALLVVVAVGSFFVVKLLDDLKVWPPDDYVEYWAAGRLNLTGQNPYSADQLLPLERFAGRDTDEAIMMWNPPWTLTVAMPLGVLPPRVGQLLWLMLNLGAIGLSAWLLWRTFGGRADKTWVAFAVAFTFMPSLFALNTGQISALLLLGCALFAWCVRRGYLFAAGAAACLIAIKPHLAYLFWLAVGLDALVNHRWRIVLGGVVTGLIATAIPMAFNPDVWAQYVEAYRSSPVPPSKWVSLTPGIILRLIFGAELFWLQFVPMAAGLAWFTWCWRKNGTTWNWIDQLPWLVLVSFVTAPYGAWHFDLVLLLLPIVHRAADYLPGLPRVGDERAGWLPLAVLILANVAMFVMTRIGVYSYWFAWVAPLVLLTYAGTLRWKFAKPVARMAEVATA
jgi:Glycosyltransferase family 87